MKTFFFSGAIAFLGIGVYLLLSVTFAKLRRDLGLPLEEVDDED